MTTQQSIITSLPNAYDRRGVKGAVQRAVTAQTKAGEITHEALVHCVLAARPENTVATGAGGTGFGDITYLRDLLNLMPRSARVEAMVDWVQFFFPIWVKKGDNGLWSVGVYREGKSKKWKPWNFLGDATSDNEFAQRGALNVPFDLLTDERPQKPLSLSQLLGMIKDATAKVQKAKDDGRPVVGENEEALRRLNAAAAALGDDSAAFIAKLKEAETAEIVELNKAREARMAERRGETTADLGEDLRKSA